MLYEDNYLAHYGVKNMRWGVRRFQNEDGTLTEEGKRHYGVREGGNKKLAKKYKHEMAKMEKLAGRTDIAAQKVAAEKHNKRAGIAAGAGSAATGYALTRVLGIKKFNKEVDDQMRAIAKTAERDVNMNYDWYNKKINTHLDDIKQQTDALSSWEVQSNPQLKKDLTDLVNRDRTEVKKYERYAKQAAKQINDQAASDQKALEKLKKDEVVDTKAKVALGVAAGAYGIAAYEKARASAANRRTTEKGHAKAVTEARAQYQKMQKTFANTPYINLFRDEIAAYKKEHPNTQLTNKQIMKNLM